MLKRNFVSILFKASKQLSGMLGSGDPAAAPPFPQSAPSEEPPASEKEHEFCQTRSRFYGSKCTIIMKYMMRGTEKEFVKWINS